MQSSHVCTRGILHFPPSEFAAIARFYSPTRQPPENLYRIEMKTWRLGIAADHGGFDLKQELVTKLRAMGHDVMDYGAHSLMPGDDFPDFVIPLANAVTSGKVERGLAVCGSGVGAAVCANKVKGVRACLIQDHFSARQGVEDDHMNILCLGGRTVGRAVAWDLIVSFLAAEYGQAERYLRRLAKISDLENGLTNKWIPS